MSLGGGAKVAVQDPLELLHSGKFALYQTRGQLWAPSPTITGTRYRSGTVRYGNACVWMGRVGFIMHAPSCTYMLRAHQTSTS